MNIRIGCSGFYYPAWKNKFYPTGLLPRKWLEYYSSIFNTVELNGTFYRIPKLADLQKQASITPDNFRFSVKMNRFITHIKQLKDIVSITTFQDLVLNGLSSKLACFLFQMPPGFKYSEENLERVIESIPHHTNNVIEFRHISWWNDDTIKALHDAGITFVNVDFPGLESYVINTYQRFYMRLHGNPELFASSYSEDQIRHYFNQLPSDCKDAYFYFNNTMFEAGYTNAQQLMKIIGSH